MEALAEGDAPLSTTGILHCHLRRGFRNCRMNSSQIIFLTSSNAVTQDGMLVNIDGNGNRVSGMAWGNNTLIFVVGMNKLTATIDEAISRTRNTATPPNALRLKLDTPCTKTGYCVDCSSPDRVCKALLILERATGGRKSHVILVGEDLGF